MIYQNIFRTKRDSKAVHNRFSPTLEQKHRREIDESPSFKFYARNDVEPRAGWQQSSFQGGVASTLAQLHDFRSSPFSTIAVERKRLSVLKILFPPQLVDVPENYRSFPGSGSLIFIFCCQQRQKSNKRRFHGARDVIKFG